MTDEADDRSQRWGLPASAALHALVAALVIFGLPLSLPQPQEEQAVSVTIEPAPEEAEAAAAAPPPPPPAEPAEPEEPAEPLAQAQQQAAAPLPVLQPVVKYGETDAGPREALDGAGAEDTPDPPTQSVAEERTDAAAQETPAADEPQPAEAAESTDSAATDASEESESAADVSSGASVPELVASTAGDDALPPSESKPTEPKPTETAAASASELQEARRLFSRSATGRTSATTAMADLPRGVRAGRLCETELLLQLRYGATPYFPELLPSLRLNEGTVLAIPQGAFRARGAWYDLSFECQIDPQATQVVSFALRVGAPLSRAEAQRRGLPSR